MDTAELPRWFFATGDEPVGLRVTPYHKPGGLSHILDTLEEDEIEVIRRSSFGKFLELVSLACLTAQLQEIIYSVCKSQLSWLCVMRCYDLCNYQVYYNLCNICYLLCCEVINKLHTFVIIG